MAWAAAVILFWAWTLPFTEPTDTTVICTFSEDCVLPCSFTPVTTADEVIHWNRNSVSVHAYYHYADHVETQDPRFKGRTSLFKDQIKNGNASLLLQNCNIEDSGAYQCYTSTTEGNTNTIVNVKVHASIQSVSIKIKDNNVNCLSQDIYPAPNVSWTTDPPTQLDILKDPTPINQDDRGLYSVQSKVRMLGNLSDYTYICSVTSADGMQKWTTSLRQQELSAVNGGNMTIPCLAPGTFKPPNFILNWTITGENNAEVILTFHSQTRQISNHSKNWATVFPDQVLKGNGSLLLHNLENSARTGNYTCEFSAFRNQHLVYTNVILAPEPHRDDQGFYRHWAATTVAFLLFVVVVLVLLVIRCKTHTPKGNDDTREPKGHSEDV